MTATAVNRSFCVTKPNVYRRFLKVKSTFVSIVVMAAFAALGSGLSLIFGWACSIALCNNHRTLYHLSRFVIKLSDFAILVVLCNNTCRTL